jgi:hypothetical protein
MPKTVDVFGGSFSPQEVVVTSGKEFDVTFSLYPTIAIPYIAINFVLPADQVALVSGGQEWAGDLKKDEPLSLTLSFVADGAVDAYVKADVKASSIGQNYQSSYYLHVITSNPEEKNKIVSDSMNPGFLRSVNQSFISVAPNNESSRAQQNLQDPQSTTGTFEVKGRFVYIDENGGYSSARYMEVRLRDNNEASWSVTGWTNETGYFDFVVVNSANGRSPIIDLIAEGRWDWKGMDSVGVQYWWSSGVLAANVADGYVYSNNDLSPSNNNDILQAGDAVYAEAQWIYDWTSWQRSKVTINWPVKTGPSNTGDAITLPNKSAWSWGHVQVQHEDAHCVMWALYGYWPIGSGPDPHYVWSESSPGFAFIEGWAEFMQCVVDNNPNNLMGYFNGSGGNIETNDWFNCIDTGDRSISSLNDGNIIEGSVASILWDIFDPVDIAGDNDYMAWGFDEIFTLLQNDKPLCMGYVDYWPYRELWFFDDWSVRWPDISTSKGPLCNIYWDYGIDEDYFTPWGSVIINSGDTYTNSRVFTLTLDFQDWGAGVHHMRFSEDYGVTWGQWYNPATTFTYTINSTDDGWKYIDVQYADYWWLSKAGTIFDGIALDTTPPTGSITINSDATYTTSRTVTLNLDATDNYAGVKLMRFAENMGSWGSWIPFALTFTYTLTTPNDGSKSVDVQFQDNAGQNSTMWEIYDYIYLDTTKPTGTAIINNGSIATASTSVYLNLTYSDTGSGISKIRFCNTGDPWSAWETPSPNKAWIIPSGDGTKNVWVEVMDNAGLISDQFYDGIILDTVNPGCGIGIGIGHPAYTTTAAVTLYLIYIDYGSGVYQVRYKNVGESWTAWEAPAATKSWTLTAGDGTKRVYYQVMDYAGQTSVTNSDIIILDTTTPNGSIIINEGAATTTTTSVTLTLTYSDSRSGVYQVRYGNIGQPWSAWEAPSATKAWTLTSGAGIKTVRYQVMDNAGLVSTMYSDDITLTASFGLKELTSWYWTSNTVVNSVASGDIDRDGFKEIVTGGYFFDGTRTIAQLIVWNGSNLAVERIQSWYWTGNTTINSVALGDVDGDGQVEVVTGGYFNDGVRNIAQLIEWTGSSLSVDRIQSWYWTSNTVINSVALGDVDGDGQVEIVSGGFYNDGVRNVAQLVVWSGSSLAIDRLTGWYWTGNTVINSVALGDVDNDGQVEVVSGGYYSDGVRNVAQLIEWNGLNLGVDRLVGWYWTSNTVINSLALGDVDNDGQTEIVTGGFYNDGVRDVAQLVVWSGTNLDVDRLTCWYWTGSTAINSLAIGDVNGDGQIEVVSGGSYFDGARNVAQMVVWSGSSLAAVDIRTWYWTGSTAISTIAIGDANDDFSNEIVTGGAFYDGTRLNSQLTIWGIT